MLSYVHYLFYILLGNTRNINLTSSLIILQSNENEKAFLFSCLDINKKLTPTFPSKLRNKINYPPLYGVEAVDKKIYPIIHNSNWIKEIMSFDVGEIKNNDNRMINICVAYTTYIEKLSYRLLQDYFEMQGWEDHILAQVNAHREDKIIIPNVPFLY